MGRYVTPSGVVIELGDEAARAVGYKPADAKPAPAKRGRPKKVDESSADEK